ncbi:MAG: rhodanese-like domain-containing protein [Syntrophales bacterium]
MRIKTATPVFLILAVLLAPAQGAGPDVTVVGPAALHKMMQQKNTVVVDLMSRIECMDHRIAGSLCIACEEFAEKAPRRLREKKARVVVLYCDGESCDCKAAVESLQKGYPGVYMLKGGLSSWKQAGYATESEVRVPRAAIESIDPDSLGKLLGEKSGPLIVDIRSEASFKEGHIPGAANIPFYRLQERYQEIPLDRRIIVVDERGSRSYLAASYLAEKGFEDVNWLTGGMEKWNARLCAGKVKVSDHRVSGSE